MQVVPISPVLKVPETILLKLRCDGPLSNVALIINLRHHIQVSEDEFTAEVKAGGVLWIENMHATHLESPPPPPPRSNILPLLRVSV